MAAEEEDDAAWALREAKKAWWRKVTFAVTFIALFVVGILSEVVELFTDHYSMRLFGVAGMLVTVMLASGWLLRPKK